MVTDAAVIAAYYRDRYGRSSEMIPYGAETGRLESHAVLERLALERAKYILYVSRLEPENNPELVLNAYRRTATEWPLVSTFAGTGPTSEKRISSRGLTIGLHWPIAPHSP